MRAEENVMTRKQEMGYEGTDTKAQEYEGTDTKAQENVPVSKKSSAGYITPRHVRIPHLREKVELLYRYHPFIRKQYELAKEVGVSPATLATWISGVISLDGIRVNPGTIPAKHFNTFAKIFGVPGPVLEM